jgi:hypothetical protein
MLKLSIQCTRVESNYSSCTGKSTQNKCSSSEGAQEKGKRDETQFTTKIGGKTSLGPSYFVLKIFIRIYAFDGLLCPNWPFSLPNHLTSQITLLYKGKNMFCHPHIHN